ncbi:MAG: cobalamin B12-binding domain-containing protein [Candidatus Eisenbacteria bacterium]|nr:cobalamin B12-binding domain-containing protein [Candidatus Eisenbacteria bacterium]
MQRKIRVLVGKPGLDGHDRGAKVVAAALRDAGMEVIYTGLHQTPEQIVEAALQEDVDVVALSILSGAHMRLFPEVLELMRRRGVGDRLLTGGGIIPPEDVETLAKLGVGRLFGPGSSTQDIARYIREWFVGVHGEDSLAPMPVQPAGAQTDLFEGPMPLPSPSPAPVKPDAHHARAARRTAARRAKQAVKKRAPARTARTAKAVKRAKPAPRTAKRTSKQKPPARAAKPPKRARPKARRPAKRAARRR